MWGSDNEDDDTPITLTVNSRYARTYDEKKRHEELSQLRDKYGDLPESRLSKVAALSHKYGSRAAESLAHEFDDDVLDGEDDYDSDSEIEDETGELVTPAVDQRILQTILKIRSKDPEVYDPNTHFFKDMPDPEELETEREKPVEDKPVRLKDFHRERMLKLADGKTFEEVDEEERAAPPPPAAGLSFVQEQEKLKKELKQAISATAEPQDEDGEDFFTLRPGSNNAHAADDTGPDGEWDWEKFRNSKLAEADPDEQFLLKYVLNEGWKEKDLDRIPTYKEIVDPNIDLDEDEDAVDAAEDFERKHNFRFEEGENATQILTHSRTVDGSLRRNDDRRKQQRAAKSERKAQEKARKSEELKRLKNLKRTEIAEKLKQIQEISGNPSVGMLDNVDLEGDFDPDAYDAKMSQIFGDEYYGGEGEAVVDDGGKPVFDEIDVSDLLGGGGGGGDVAEEEAAEEQGTGKKKKKKGKKGKKDDGTGADNTSGGGGRNDDDAFIMDADYLPGGEKYGQEMPSASSEANAKSKKSKIPLGEYLDETYTLDYEDLIASTIPTRFKYRKVEPTTFGLTPAEILLADETELNTLVSIKALAPYRNDDQRRRDRKRFGGKSAKKRLRDFRKGLLEKVKEGGNLEEAWAKHIGGGVGASVAAAGGGGDKKRKREEGDQDEHEADKDGQEPAAQPTSSSKRRRRRKKGQAAAASAAPSSSSAATGGESSTTGGPSNGVATPPPTPSASSSTSPPPKPKSKSKDSKDGAGKSRDKQHKSSRGPKIRVGKHVLSQDRLATYSL